MPTYSKTSDGSLKTANVAWDDAFYANPERYDIMSADGARWLGIAILENDGWAFYATPDFRRQTAGRDMLSKAVPYVRGEYTAVEADVRPSPVK